MYAFAARLLMAGDYGILVMHAVWFPKINPWLVGDCWGPADLNLALLFPHPLLVQGLTSRYWYVFIDFPGG